MKDDESFYNDSSLLNISKFSKLWAPQITFFRDGYLETSVCKTETICIVSLTCRWVKKKNHCNWHWPLSLASPSSLNLSHKDVPKPSLPPSHSINKASIHAIFVNVTRRGWYAPAMILSTAFSLCHHIRTNPTKWLLSTATMEFWDMKIAGWVCGCVCIVSYRPLALLGWYDIFSLKSPPQRWPGAKINL